jgi:Arm DNA-binding domain
MNSEQEPDVLKFQKKTAKVKLTKRTVAALPLPAPGPGGKPAKEWVYDSEVPRLAICAWSSGAKTWVWVGRCGGKFVKLKLGDFPEMAPEQAQKAAAKTSALVLDGIDPRLARKESRKKTEPEPTLAELLERYLRHASDRKKTWKADEKQFLRYSKKEGDPLWKLKGRSYSTITWVELGDMAEKMGERHGRYATNRLLALLSKMYSFAEARMGFTKPNPAKSVERFPEKSRDRCRDSSRPCNRSRNCSGTSSPCCCWSAHGVATSRPCASRRSTGRPRCGASRTRKLASRCACICRRKPWRYSSAGTPRPTASPGCSHRAKRIRASTCRNPREHGPASASGPVW